MGIDPGSRITGWGVVRSGGATVHCEGYGAIRPPAANSPAAMPSRLLFVHRELLRVMAQVRPDVVAVESVFHAANSRSALILGHVRGVVLLAAAELDLVLVECSPLEVKKAVAGYGRADKQQVQTMVRRLLNLKEPPEPYDAADALAVALCRIFTAGRPSRRRGRWRESDLQGLKVAGS